MNESAVIAPVAPSVGDKLAGGWEVERTLSDVCGLSACLVTDGVGGRAVCFVLPSEAPDPPLDEDRAARWGTVRRVFRDEQWGRLVVDGVFDGDLLSDRMAAGEEIPAAWTEDLESRARAEHREGTCHGQIAPDRIVAGGEGLSVAGWGLARGDAEALPTRDLAGIAALAGTGAAPASASPVPRLQAAMAADHLPTLRAALEQAEAAVAAGFAMDDAELRRGRDALHRLEDRVAGYLESAETMLARNDPLGAVAACREAIRLGEEGRAEAMLQQARRQAKRILGGKQASDRRWWIAGATAAVLVVVALVGFWVFRAAPASGLDSELALVEEQAGRRGVVRWLAERDTRGEATPEMRERLVGEFRRLVDEQRSRLIELRREAVARGARPHRADQLAESSLAALESLAAVDVVHLPTPAQIDSALRGVDGAATRYRASTEIDVETATVAVDRLLATDPVFGTGDTR